MTVQRRSGRFLVDTSRDSADLSVWLMPPKWTEQAVCSSVDPDLFFPEKGGGTRSAKLVCARCPVRTECLEYALANGEREGVWGGLSPRPRQRLLRETKAA